MIQRPHQIASRETPAGTVSLLNHCTPETIRGFDFDTFFGLNDHRESIFIRRETLESRAANPESSVVLAVTKDRRIAGFGVFAPPDAEDRWSQMQAGAIMEVELVEVHEQFRTRHIAGDMLRLMLGHPRIERMIVFMVGYVWTWDLDGTGLNAQAYHNMLMRLFSPFGFRELKTNEANICLRPENLFMARIGSDVPDEWLKDFKYLRFGVTPQRR